MSGINTTPVVGGSGAALPPTTAPAGGATPPPLTDAQKEFATKHPSSVVDVERTGPKWTARILGGLAAVAGVALAGVGLARGGGAAPVAIGAAVTAAGAGAALLIPGMIKDSKRVVVASQFDSRREAQLLANSMVGRRIDVVESVDGKFSIADMGPVSTSGPNPRYRGGDYYPYDPYYGNNYGGSYYHQYPQYYPDYSWDSYPDYPDYSYPNVGGGSTSPGDDY